MAVKCVIALSIFVLLITCQTAQQCDPIRVPGKSGADVVEAVLTSLQAIRPDIKDGNIGVFLRRIAWVESKYGTFRTTYRAGYHGGIWQVDKIGFLDTQDTQSHPGLVEKHKLIKKAFQIDWAKVTWRDLRKPLYSGIAALLYLSNNPAAIPADLDGQAEYWKDHYNSASGLGTKQKFLDDVNALENSQ